LAGNHFVHSSIGPCNTRQTNRDMFLLYLYKSASEFEENDAVDARICEQFTYRMNFSSTVYKVNYERDMVLRGSLNIENLVNCKNCYCLHNKAAITLKHFELLFMEFRRSKTANLEDFDECQLSNSRGLYRFL
jgi:hypothetical protein